MDRTPLFRPSDRPYGQGHATYQQQPFPPPTAQPPLQIPHSDPFQTNRDPFLPGTHTRRGSFGLTARAWPPAQGNGIINHPHPQSTPPPPQTHPFPPPPHAPNGVTQMALPYDPSRRRSPGGGPAGSPPQPNQGLLALSTVSHAVADMSQGPLEHPAPPPSYHARQMPPPSPPHLPPSASSMSGAAPRGPPNASPFAGLRDLASFSSSHRPAGGMSISSMLGGGEERNSHSSPNVMTNTTATPKSMPPPSPGRARSSSMREPDRRGFGEASPPRNIHPDHQIPGPNMGQVRTMNEPIRDGMFGSPQFHHGFRAFQPMQREQGPGMNGQGPQVRPSSQPIDQTPPRNMDDMIRREPPYDGRFSTFRHFGEPQAPSTRNEMGPRNDVAPYRNGDGPTSQPATRELYRSPQLERQRSNTGPGQFRSDVLGTPMREDQAGLFRPAYRGDGLRDSMESPRFQHIRRSEVPRSSPLLSDVAAAERVRLGLIGGPMTLEDHQRMEAMHREQQQNRKGSDGSVHRAVLNISPELNRKGRNSPLPQAVQGAQPRHIGPGGDNPGIKMEFGRMFSGLGSGVGTATPTAGQSMNGTMTPSRMSPMRHLEGGDLVRTAVAEIESDRSHGKASGRGGRKAARQRVDADERINGNGTETPDQQRGAKRSKINHTAHHHHHVHPHHHHHHHHHEPIDTGPSPFNMLRFPSNPPSQNASAPHHHHHHHTSHAHPGHHHHHVPRAAPARKPTTTVMSSRLVEEAAKKPRKHMGSQLYCAELSTAPAAETPLDSKIKFSSSMKPIPRFEGKENCTYTVRVPRLYLGGASILAEKSDAEYFQEICRHRNLYGTDVYTDDSDVLAAAVHSGWIKGDYGDFNDDIRKLCDNESEQDELDDEVPTTLAIKPRKPIKVPPGRDALLTLLILPTLESYASTNQHHIWSREWTGTHDGMSFMIHRIDFVEESPMNRITERSAMGRKQRLAAEEAKRREAAAGLVMFAGGGGGVTVGA